MAKPDRIFASELEGREVMDLRAGEVIGAVTDFCLTRDGNVTLIGVLPLQWYRGGKGIAPGAVTNITRERVSIDDSSLLQEFGPNSEELLSYTFDAVMGKEVLQQDGELLGVLADFAFDLGEGRITDVVVFDGGDEGKRQKISVERIQTIGRNYVVVSRAGAAAEVEPGPKPAASTATAGAAAETAESGRPRARRAERKSEPAQAKAAAPPAPVATPAAEVAPPPAPKSRPAKQPPVEDDDSHGGAAVADEPAVRTELPPIAEELDAPVTAASADPRDSDPGIFGGQGSAGAGQMAFGGAAAAAPEPQPAGLDALHLSALDRRKAEFLLGKQAHRDIAAADGTALLSRGKPFSERTIGELLEQGLLTEVFIEMTSYRA